MTTIGAKNKMEYAHCNDIEIDVLWATDLTLSFPGTNQKNLLQVTQVHVH